MNRKDFLSQVGIGAAAFFIPMCIGGLSGCKKTDTAPKNVNFTIDVSTGELSNNGGYLIKDGVLVARTNQGIFIAVSAACTHEGTDVYYNSGGNNFVCPSHGSKFSSNGGVTQGPANSDLASYNTELSGSSLRVFS